MTFGQLRTFLAVIRARSIRGAAAALYVSEPSVSAAVGALEKELGVDLFERVGRGLRASPAGEAFARYAAEALGLLEQGRAAARAADEPGSGRLRLVAVTTAGEYIVPPLLQAFRRTHPGIEPVLEVGNRALTIERLIAREADLAIGGRPPTARGIAGTPILPNRLIAVASPEHPLARARTITAEQLSAETWLMREDGSGTVAAAEEYAASTGIEMRARLTLGSNGAVKQAAMIGLGITLLSEDAVSFELADGRLVRLRAPGLPLRRRWHVLYPERGAPTPQAAAFLRFARSAVARRAVR